MDRSPGFGPAPCDYGNHRFPRAVDACFHCGSASWMLNLAAWRSSPDRSTKSTRSHFAIMVPQLVNTGFQVLFHSPSGVLFTFPSQYCALSVTEEYLALRGGPRAFPQDFTCPAVLWIPPCRPVASLTGVSPSPPGLPRAILLPRTDQSCGPNPRALMPWFGLLPVRSPLLGKSFLLSFPPAT